MKPLACFVFASLLALAAGAPQEDAAKAERDKLQGTWLPVSYVADGMKKEPADYKNHKLVIEGEKFSMPDRGKGTFTIDPAKTPKTMDLRYDREPGDDSRVRPVLGVYELDGDMLKLHVDKRRRPKDFTPPDAGGGSLITYKREKP